MDYLFITLLFAHWVGDFVFQTHYQSVNKSSSFVVLARHVFVYTVTVTIGLMLAYLVVAPGIFLDTIYWFFGITFVAHFITDAITSRINSELWRQSRVHYFFVSVGFDQFLHAVQLFFTLKWVLTGSII